MPRHHHSASHPDSLPDVTRVRRNIRVAGRRTSVSLESAVWESLFDIGRRENRTIDQICSEVDRVRDIASLASALRVFVLVYFRAIAAPPGREAMPGFAEDGDYMETALSHFEQR